MKLKLQQAVYGEKDNAHKMITYRGGDKEILQKIYRFTDIPASLPPGTSWKPYFSGLPYKDYYILSKTFSDENAQRKGMVLTHVLLLNLNEIVYCNNLTPLWQMFPNDATREIENISSEIEIPDHSPQIKNPEKFLDAPIKLLKTPNDELPVIWRGQDGFQDLVNILWANFSPSVRKNFSFGISFTPDDLTGRNLTIANTISPKESKYRNSQIIEEPNANLRLNPVHAYMLGFNEKGASKITSFIEEIDLQIESLEQMKFIDSILPSTEKIRNNESMGFTEVLSLIRLLELLAPNDDKGMPLKQKIVKKFVELIKTASLSELKKLRNLSLSGFSGYQQEIVEGLTEWFDENLDFDNSVGEAEAMFLNLIHENFGVLSEAAVKFLNLKSNNAGFLTSVIWEIWNRYPSNVNDVDKLILLNKGLEKDFAQKCPAKISKELGENLVVWCTDKKWMMLRFLVLISFCPLTKALSDQLKVTKRKFKEEWLKFAGKRVANTALVQSAVEIDDPHLLEIAGKFCNSQPEILSSLDLLKPATQKLWLRVYEDNEDFWKKIKNPSEKVYSLVDLLIENKEVEPELLFQFSKSEYADLTFYTKRREIWKHLHQEVKKNFIMATARGWLSYFSSKDWKHEIVEGEIENVVTDYRFFREFLVLEISTAPAILVKYHGHFSLGENRFDKDLIFIQERLNRIDFIDSVSIGELISERNWSWCANRIAKDINWWKREDLIPAANKCISLISSFNRGWAWLYGSFDAEPINQDEWWEIFEDKISDLYPSGPQEEEIWSRAKGKKKILDYSGSGRERWHKALRLLRNGGGGKKISAQLLLECALEDYSEATDLKTLLNLAQKLNIN